MLALLFYGLLISLFSMSKVMSYRREETRIMMLQGRNFSQSKAQLVEFRCMVCKFLLIRVPNVHVAKTL